MQLTALCDGVSDQLAAVERRFNEELNSPVACVNALTRHLARFRGKMLRPTLLLLSGKASGELCEAHVTLATVVEMVHMATLVHDDVLDEAELRRKGATINHLRGNEAAVLLGDFLISHSFHLCSSLESQFASRLIGKTTNQVCEGELLQIHHRNNIELDEETYFRIITSKTGSLVAASCLLGAKFAGADEQAVRGLEMFGMNIGTAFQIQDDILDLAGQAKTVGKTLGIDIEKGKLTLPLIHFLRHAPREHRALLRSLLDCHEPDRAERIGNLVLPSASMEYARKRAREHIEAARGALSTVADSESRRTLDGMAEFVISRPL